MRAYDHIQVYTGEGGGLGMMMMMGEWSDHSTSRLPFPSFPKAPCLELASGKLSNSFLRMHARAPATLPPAGTKKHTSNLVYYLHLRFSFSTGRLLLTQIYCDD